MKKNIRTVALIGKPRDLLAAERIAHLAEFLRARGLAVVLEQGSAALLPPNTAPTQALDTIGKNVDLAVVVGGDGTLLNVARHLAPHRVPLIGVNLGRLGFLADIRPNDMIDAIGHILDGDYQSESRLLLAAEIVRQGKVVHTASAFNDVIITKGELARLIEFETYLDDEFVNSTRGDGAIVASPTGSTAYALSAGGPILHPGMPALVLVPICPHTLSNRPIVVSSDSVIKMVITGSPDQRAHVSFDGQSSFSLEDNDHVFVRRAAVTVELVHPSSRRHFDVLREKLLWGKKL